MMQNNLLNIATPFDILPSVPVVDHVQDPIPEIPHTDQPTNENAYASIFSKCAKYSSNNFSSQY